MSVCLTKRFEGREYTPVHICDEIYPNARVDTQLVISPDTAEVTKYVYETLLLSSKLEDAFSKFSTQSVSCFFGASLGNVNNVTVVNNKIVYGKRKNPLAEAEVYKESKLLNDLCNMFVCLESRLTTFESFCNFLVNNWTSSREFSFYQAICQFLADVKSGNTSDIEGVLSKDSDSCYNAFFNFENDCMRAFMNEIYTRLFSDLHSLFSREKNVFIHPLFLFACRNFGAKPCDEIITDVNLYFLEHNRAELKAYVSRLMEHL